MTDQKTTKRGFAAMTPEKQRAIASKGGRVAHERGKAHEFTPDEARVAGRKGGLKVSQNRQHMGRIGREGGKARRGGTTPSPQPIAEGVAPTLEEKLGSLAYPISRTQLLEQVGSQTVARRNESPVDIHALLAQSSRDGFSTVGDVLEEVDRLNPTQQRESGSEASQAA